MSERDGYAPGVPCWVDHSSNEPAAAAAFYIGLFDWDAVDRMPEDAPGHYFMCTQADKAVTAIGSQSDDAMPPLWNTYIWVDSADEAAAAARAAGGTVLAEPFDVFTAGRMAVLLDPAGAVTCAWQPGDHRGAQLVNEPNTLTWNELVTTDVEATKRFYGAVFGWQTTEMAPDSGYLLIHPAGVAEPKMETSVGGILAASEGQPSHWTTYFAVADTDAVAARTPDLDGSVTVAPFDSTVGRIAVLKDSLGTPFAVIQTQGAS